MKNSEEISRVAGIDYGQARIGVAVSDPLGFLAHPRPFVPAKPPQRALRALVSLFASEEIRHLLVGLPRNMDGSEGLSARRARKFAQALQEASGLAVEMIDERLSTVGAQARLHEAGRTVEKSRSRIDSASAAVLLQAWLDARRGQEG